VNLFMIGVAIFMAFMPIPHILKMMETRSSVDQSIFGICGVALGIACWIVYGIYAPDPTIVWANIIMLVTYLAYLGTAVYYRIKV